MAIRVSTNSIINKYQNSLMKIQSDKVKEQLRLTTGEFITEIADDPRRFVASKNLDKLIARNTAIKNNIELTLNEFSVVDEQLRSISEKLQTIRQTAIDSTLTGNTGNLHSLGIYVKGILEDIIKDANLDFNGHFVFSGTKTTPVSLEKIGSENYPYPFELIQDNPTKDNPSGLRIVYKGNFKDREINKDAYHTEVINAKANELFGKNGTEILETIVKLYNLMAYNSDGTPRAFTDVYSVEDQKKLDEYQKQIADQIISINAISADIGAKYKRFDDLRLQINNEELLLKDFLSQEKDTDIAQSTLELKKAENALSYTLQVGSTIINKSLFDFLSL